MPELLSDLNIEEINAKKCDNIRHKIVKKIIHEARVNHSFRIQY